MSWEITHNFLGWQQGSSAAFLALLHWHTWELLHLEWAQNTVNFASKMLETSNHTWYLVFYLVFFRSHSCLLFY